MGLVVGTAFGAGAFLVWWACWAPPVEAAPRRSRVVERWQDELVQAGMGALGLRGLLVMSTTTGAFAGLLVLGASGVPSVATAFALLASGVPPSVVRARARHRRQSLRDMWPEVVDNLASGVRAGLSLPEALGQLGERGPEPLRPAFAAFAQDHRATGRFGDALDALKARLADPVADRVVEALRVTREVGGSDLGRLLRTLSAFLREDARTRAELEARQSWTVNGARLAVAAPWLVLALLATRPESVRAYDSAEGAGVLVAGAASSLVAYRIMLRIGRLPDDPRVLR